MWDVTNWVSVSRTVSVTLCYASILWTTCGLQALLSLLFTSVYVIAHVCLGLSTWAKGRVEQILRWIWIHWCSLATFSWLFSFWKQRRWWRYAWLKHWPAMLSSKMTQECSTDRDLVKVSLGHVEDISKHSCSFAFIILNTFGHYFMNCCNTKVVVLTYKKKTMVLQYGLRKEIEKNDLFCVL